MNPKVSIVIPSYNREALLRNTLETIFDQHYEPVEVIVIDDGSDDDTRSLRAEYPIRYFYLNRPGWTNPSRACNVGIRQARGSILILQGGETIHGEETIQRFVDHLKTRPNDWVFATVYDTDAKGHATGQLSGPARTTHGWFLCALQTKYLVNIRGVDEDYDKPAYDDADLADRLVKYGLRPTYPHTIFGTHQYHPRNHSPKGISQMAALWRKKTELMAKGELGVIRNIDREWGAIDYPEGTHPLD